MVRARGEPYHARHSDTVDWLVTQTCINAARIHKTTGKQGKIRNFIITQLEANLLKRVYYYVSKSRIKLVDVEDYVVEDGQTKIGLDPPPADSLLAKVTERMKTSRLTMQERAVLLARYGIHAEQLSLRECAEAFRKNPVQIRKIEVSALKKLGALG